MASARTKVEAPPDVVFEVICDPASYALWVVGAKHVRGVDADWPQPGSLLHHTVGWGPFQDHDTTKVLELERARRLRLEARLWPFGTAEVDLRLSPADGGTELIMHETPVRGPAARFDNPAMQIGLYARNVWALRRLCRWAEERYRGTPGHQPARPA